MPHPLRKLAALLLLTTAASAYADDRSTSWVVSEATGTVHVNQAGRIVAATRGMTVQPGATLSTGPGSRAIVVRGRDFVTVAPGSRINLPADGEKRGFLQLVQEWGNAIFQIEKQAKPHFGVRTPYLAAVVKGTTFSITVGAEGASLQVVEGLVETSTIDGGASELIRPGAVAQVRSDDPYRLSIQGQDLRQIDSPQRSTPPAAAPAAPAAAPAAESTSTTAEIAPQSVATEPAATPSEQGATGTDTASGAGANGSEAMNSQVISTGVVADQGDLTRMTAGLVSNGSDQLALNTVVVSTRAAEVDVRANDAASQPSTDASASASGEESSAANDAPAAPAPALAANEPEAPPAQAVALAASAPEAQTVTTGSPASSDNGSAIGNSDNGNPGGDDDSDGDERPKSDGDSASDEGSDDHGDSNGNGNPGGKDSSDSEERPKSDSNSGSGGSSNGNSGSNGSSGSSSNANSNGNGNSGGNGGAGASSSAGGSGAVASNGADAGNAGEVGIATGASSAAAVASGSGSSGNSGNGNSGNGNSGNGNSGNGNSGNGNSGSGSNGRFGSGNGAALLRQIVNSLTELANSAQAAAAARAGRN